MSKVTALALKENNLIHTGIHTDQWRSQKCELGDGLPPFLHPLPFFLFFPFHVLPFSLSFSPPYTIFSTSLDVGPLRVWGSAVSGEPQRNRIWWL